MLNYTRASRKALKHEILEGWLSAQACSNFQPFWPVLLVQGYMNVSVHYATYAFVSPYLWWQLVRSFFLAQAPGAYTYTSCLVPRSSVPGPLPCRNGGTRPALFFICFFTSSVRVQGKPWPRPALACYTGEFNGKVQVSWTALPKWMATTCTPPELVLVAQVNWTNLLRLHCNKDATLLPPAVVKLPFQ